MCGRCSSDYIDSLDTSSLQYESVLFVVQILTMDPSNSVEDIMNKVLYGKFKVKFVAGTSYLFI